jgi:hypothetical protein
VKRFTDARRLLSPRARHDARALIDEHSRDRETDARRRGGDDADTVAQAEVHSPLP